MKEGRSARQYKDPERSNLGPWCNPSPADLNRVGYWSDVDREKQDAQFRLAMTAAITSGAEHAVTGMSTHFGTKAPRTGYERP